MKRALATLLCSIILLALLPTTAFATPTISFTTQPASSTTVKEGSISGSLTAEAQVVPSGSGLTPALKWFECAEDGIASGPLLSTSTTLTIPTTIKAKAFEDGMMASETSSATYTINQLPELVLAASPSDTVTQGTAVTLTATPKNISDPSGYSWFCIDGDVTRFISGATQASYTPPTDTVGALKYYCFVYYGTGSPKPTEVSNVVTVTVTAPVPTVTSVAVNPASVSIQKGGTQSFNATVMGKNSPAQTVTWTVEGGVTGTSIDADGKLTIAANETAAKLTVRATSTVDPTKSGTGIVTVTTPPAPPVKTVATPSFTPAAGSYTAVQNVTLACDTTDATIRYTTDGSEPTEASPAYSTPITVSATTTIKAKAFKTGMTASEIASASYTITQAPTQHSISVLPSTNGTVTTDKQSAKSGETVTLSVTPKEGYKVKNLLILDELGNDCVKNGLITLTDNSFVMPDTALTIQATFEKIEASDTTVEKIAGKGTLPKTGDTAQTALWFVLLFIAGGLIRSAVSVNRKHRKHSE